MARVFLSDKLFYEKFNGKITEGLTINDVLKKFAEDSAVGCDGAINGIEWATSETGDPTTKLKLTFETITGTPTLVLRDCNGDLVFSIDGVFP